MRLHRIRVEHVRGLPEAEIRFATEGVTVVEAPNETGKSTVFDAFDLLLREKHSSTKQVLKDLQPEGRDVGSLVEAELTIGDVHLTVRKRFNRDRLTELAVHAPSPRQLTGHEAHDELRRILEAGTDLALFEALRFRQGRGLDSLALSDSEHLARQLDASAGGTGETGDDALYERVVAEFERYHTPTGQPGKALRDAQAALDASEEAVAALEVVAGELRDATARSVELAAERRRLEQAIATLEPELAAHRQRAEQVASLRATLATARSAAATARADAERAALQREERAQHVDAIEQLRVQLGEREIRATDASEALAAHQARLDDVANELAAAVTAEADVRTAVRTARALADRAGRRMELRDLIARRERIDAAVASAAAAESFLAQQPLSDAQLAAIRRADEELRILDARLDDAAPTFRLTALRGLTVHADGTTTTRLAQGEALDRTVPEALRVSLDGIADIEVSPGTSLEARLAERDEARRRFEKVCAEVGVADRGGAEELARTREQHQRALEERDAVVDRELAGAPREQLEDRIRRLQLLLGDGAEDVADPTGDDPQLALVTDDATDRLSELERAERDAEEAVQAARTAHDALAAEVSRLRDDATEAAASAAVDRENLASAESRLAEHRARCDDASLVRACEDAARALAEADARCDAMEAELEALHPDEVELLADNARQRQERSRRELQEVNEQAAAVGARIDVRGGEGIGEALQAACAERERRAEELRSLRARARAAATLMDAFAQARDAAYTAYREPLRVRIVQAGRLVFGDDLDVELDERLAVVGRTLGGVTLPFGQLSAGAREQLAILTALAAADLAGDDGVPLVLDDTLGYTDATRLEKLGAVLGRVRGPQVIVLTCLGSRFAAVGGATVVRLRDTIGAA